MNIRTFLLLVLTALCVAPARAQMPRYKHDHLNIYPAASVAPDLRVDGNLKEWKPQAFVKMISDPQLEDQYAVQMALAYDKDGLALAAKFTDTSPLVNRINPKIEPFKGWSGDALQIRLISDATIAHPVAESAMMSDAVTHLTLWNYSDEKLPALDVRRGMDFRDPVTLTGAKSGLAYAKTPGGYALEARVPWSVLKVKAPAPGDRWLMTMQPLWSDAEGKLAHNFFDVIRAAGFQFQRPDGWGYGEFIKAPEVETRLAAQARAETVIFAADKNAAFTIAVRYSTPKAGFVSLAIVNDKGQIVRTLLAKQERKAGAQTENWDGRDDDGKPVAPGKYGIKALVHDGITPRFIASVMQSGNPPWGNSGKYGWGADHGLPVGVASAGGATFLMWEFNEGGDYLIRVDGSGKKQWGAHISWGDFSGQAQAVAADGERVYTAKDGNGDAAENTAGIFAYDAATGRMTGKSVVSQWAKTLAKDGGANLVGLAVSPTRLFAALRLENKIVALDKATLKPLESYDVPRPSALAWRDGTVYALSDGKLVKLDQTTKAITPLVETGLDEPQKIALDAAGNIYVSRRGAQMNVAVYSPQGRALRTIGKAGGRPSVGKFDSSGMYRPNGLSVDDAGHLWVAEADSTPERNSVWNAQTGQFEREYFGTPSYAPMMAPDAVNPDQVYLHNTRFGVDYATGKWQPEATVYRRGYLGEAMVPGSEQGYGFMGATMQTAMVGARKIGYNGHGALFVAEGDRWKPFFYLGSGFDAIRALKPALPYSESYRWRDANADGLMQAAEVVPVEGSYENNIAQFGGTLWPGGVFIKGKRIYRPQGMGADGLPLYPEPKDAPRVLSGEGEAATFSNWLDVWPSLGSDWKDFYAISSRPSPINPGYRSGGGDDGVMRFTRDGQIKWRYRRVAIDFAPQAPLARIGDLFGALRIAGEIQTAGAGEIVGIGLYRGYFGFLNEDGLFVDQIGYDGGRGPAPNFDVFYIENFSGYFFRNSKNGKVYLFAGDVDGRILELQGWDSLRRFEGESVSVAPEQYAQVVAGEQTGATAVGSLAVVQGAPKLDGDLAGWDKAAVAEIALDETRTAKGRLAYDERNLYAIVKVPDASPWQNSADDWRYLFKGGDAVDIQLGAAWNGEGKRDAQAGDVRVMIAPDDQGGCRVVAMWSKVGAGQQTAPFVYKSPTGQESFERVALLENAVCRVQKDANEYVLTIALPWSELNLKAPEKFAALAGDIGILESDAGGTRTTSRRYLFNSDTTIINDIPSEVRVQSYNWGTLIFGGAVGTAVASESVDKRGLQWAGAVGNSGGAGTSLLRGDYGRGAGGVAVDGAGHIFTGGGDRIWALDENGQGLWQTALPEKDWVLAGPSFALAGDYLYFVAGAPLGFGGNYSPMWNPVTLAGFNICRVATKAGAQSEVVVMQDKIKWDPAWIRPEISLIANAAGEVFVGHTISHGDAARFGVFKVKDGELVPHFETTGSNGRVSLDEAGYFYVGSGGKVRKFAPDGQPASGFKTVDLPGLGPVPSGYSGAVMLTPGALWDVGVYGFVGRFDRAMTPAPGVIAQWNQALFYVQQIAAAPRENEFYIKSTDGLFLAQIQNEQLVLKRRFGNIPNADALALTPRGYIGVASDNPPFLRWFDFEATDAAAAPVKTQYPGAVAQGYLEGENLRTYTTSGFAFRESIPASNKVQLSDFVAEPFNAGRNHPSDIANRRLYRLAAIAGARRRVPLRPRRAHSGRTRQPTVARAAQNAVRAATHRRAGRRPRCPVFVISGAGQRPTSAGAGRHHPRLQRGRRRRFNGFVATAKVERR